MGVSEVASGLGATRMERTRMSDEHDKQTSASNRVPDLVAALEASLVAAKIAARHQEHYKSCNCLADSTVCCVPSCSCHVERAAADD